MKINQVLVESQGATVAFAFGRFNPAHQGHIEVWRTVEDAGKNWFVGTNPNTLGPNDPLTFQQKSAWMEEIYPPISGHIVAQTSVLTLAAYIFKKLRNNESATIAYVTDDTDWAWSGKLLNQYNGVEGAHGYYKFAGIIHVPSPRVSSATDLRNAARADDKVAFYHASGTDPKLTVAGKTYFDTVKEACEKYPLPVKKAKKVKEQSVNEDITFADTGNASDNGYQDAMNFRPKNDAKYTLRHKYRTNYTNGYNYGLKHRDRSINPETGKPYVVFGPAGKGEYDPVRSVHYPAAYIYPSYNTAKKDADKYGKKVVRGGVSKWKIVDKNDPAPEIFEDEQKTVAKTWDQMTPKEKISGVKGRTVWNEKTKKYYTVFDVPAEEVDEASLATMRDYFAGDENARDPYEITKQRLHFAKDKNAKPTIDKRFRSPEEYQQWLKQNKLKQISGVKEDEEAGEVKQQGQLIPFPAGTTKVHVSDVYDWYKLGQVISDLDDADPTKFGQGAPQSIIAFGSEEEESKLMPLLKRLGLRIDDIDPEGCDLDEAYHAGSLYEMLKKERTKGWALTNKRK